MTKTMQKKYARLIARVGANIKKGQPVRIYCEADQHEFITIPAWQEERLKLMVEEVPCRIYIESEDPYGLAGVNREKMQKSQMARYKVTKKYSDALENKDQWCIAAVPSYAWAKRVFPNETKTKA